MIATSQGFKFSVSLTHVNSGETVEFEETWDYPGYVRDDDWEHDPVFLWSDGNYSCNCNRDLFFHWNKGDKNYRHSDGSKDCGHFDNYRVNWIRNLETGNIVYEGDE
jgi:hypothetical protein